MKTTIAACLVALGVAMPAAAQPLGDEPTYSIRLFGLVSAQQFAAKNTFDAIFGSKSGTFVGGGLEVVHTSGIFADIEVSRVSKSGERAFVNNGQVFQLGIPLKATLTPVDFMAGYRRPFGSEGRFVPYAAVGATSLGYRETSDFSDPGEEVDTRKVGFILAAGLEFRASRFLGISADIADTRVTGIIGDGGVSQQFGEDNLGGVAFRARVIIGR